jgi:hypothetical protein
MRIILQYLLVSACGIAVLSRAIAEGDPGAGFQGYPDAPPFTVAPRDGKLSNYPCSTCHQYKPPDPTPRKLAMAHPELNHGNGRFWCLSCHDAENRDQLHNFRGEGVPFEQAHLVCGQCHGPQHRDWHFGAHGKRVGNWQGEREILNCPACHNPHQPAFAPRAPKPPPPVRAGLQHPPAAEHEGDDEPAYRQAMQAGSAEASE